MNRSYILKTACIALLPLNSNKIIAQANNDRKIKVNQTFI